MWVNIEYSTLIERQVAPYQCAVSILTVVSLLLDKRVKLEKKNIS